VRIEFQCPDSLVLLSDFQLWHYVLNYWYLPVTDEEGDLFEAELRAHNLSFFDTRPLPDPEFHRRVVRSWDRIFDLDWSEDGIACPRAKKSIQGTVWQVSLDQVREETSFKAP
jgi:hypothetical protein